MDIQTIEFLILYWPQIIMACVFGYCFGSISFSILFTRYFDNKIDIRDLGSGNAGFTNVLRSVGILPAIFTFIGDFSKGILACLFGKIIFSTINFCEIPDFYVNQYGMYIAGLACIIGHVYPCFFKFKGGKAILTSFAIIVMTDLRVALILLIVFLLIVIMTKIVSLASISCTILYPFLTFLLTSLLDVHNFNESIHVNYIININLISIFISFLVIYRHKNNLIRIINGEEKKIDIARKI